MGGPNKYPDQFRKDALELVKNSERRIAEVARSLGIAGTTLWYVGGTVVEAQDLFVHDLTFGLSRGMLSTSARGSGRIGKGNPDG